MSLLDIDPGIMQDRNLNIYLIGFMACGKTTVGKALAEKLRWGFVDLDEQIEKVEGKRIRDIFEESGESYFRDLERKILHEISQEKGYVISLGGGTFCFEENIKCVEKSGISFWLKCPLTEVYNRLKFHCDRPLAKDFKTLKALYYKRLSYYGKADFSIENFNKPVIKCVEEIFFVLKLRGYV